jgi:hypothetical protein
MSQELLRALNESRVAFESAGMTADVEAIDAKIAAVEEEMKPKPKKAAKDAEPKEK